MKKADSFQGEDRSLSGKVPDKKRRSKNGERERVLEGGTSESKGPPYLRSPRLTSFLSIQPLK